MYKRQSLDRSSSDIKKFERKTIDAFKSIKASTVGLFATVGVGLSTLAFTTAVKGATNYADAIDKAAKATGLTTDELQELRFAGEQLGISQKVIDDSFERLTIRLGEFASTGTGPAKKALEALNISLRENGKVLSLIHI